MTEKLCSYGRDRGETLIAYLYDETDTAARAAFEAHLDACAVCRDELDALRGVQQQLARWAPPEPRVALGGASGAAGAERRPPAAGRVPGGWWRDIPAWAQVAAALLFLGVAAGIANLDVRYDANGFAVRTGWARPAAARVAPFSTAAATAAPAAAVSRTELTALEERLRAEMRSSAPAASQRPAASDQELLRKVRTLIDESERRGQRELALRLAQAVNEMNAQRVADLRRIDATLGGVQRSLGVEVLKQQQSLNYLATRVSQRQ